MNKNATLQDTPKDLRKAFRGGGTSGQTSGQTSSQTSGMAYGHVQANLAILPESMADDFKQYCELNPRPCPLIGMSKPGDPSLPELGGDIDVRHDVSAYHVFKDGKFIEVVSHINDDLWRDDFVTFALGCSFSFEEALMDAGLTVRHIELGRNVPMYRTSIETIPSGSFSGKMVVSMRPFLENQVERVVEITSRFPRVHGAPIHVGGGHEIGVKNISNPDFGDAPEIRHGEIPVFWACGVTPQVAIEQAKPEICITHKPGHMLITDRLNSEFMD